jgi:hypothetical protein
MPAGMPYFAWVDPSETTFGPEHLRWDESIFSFALKQDEGDPASLTIVVRRPRNEAGDAIGLLGPGRKIWCWFALDCGPDLVRFRGRLVGVPTSIFEELVTLEFVARPIDLVTQKEALAETLRVLPHYDEVVIDKARRTDPEVVLEGYSKIWHYDRETHVLTVSDEITGEDGLVEFDGVSEDGKVLYDGLGLTLTSGPLARVDVVAEYTWTQQAQGVVDLTDYLCRNWPGGGRNYITSYSLTSDAWPKAGATIGDGWVVAQASASTPYDLSVKSKTTGSDITVIFSDTSWFGPSSTHTTITQTESYTEAPSALSWPRMVTSDRSSVTIGKVQAVFDIPGEHGHSTSLSRQYTAVGAELPLNYTTVTLVAGYQCNRPCHERVSFSLMADVQHVLTDPEDGEALRIDDVKSVNLSEPLGEGTGAELPIGDPRRRSYIATERGNRSLEHLIALARAHLLKRSRVVEIAFAPKLARMPEVTLRKSASLVEPRIGEALGKIVGYSIALNGSDGRMQCEARIGCAIGRGGSVVAVEGAPTYCTIDYTGADYQQFTGRTVLLDSSVGYQPPSSNPNDDGLDFTSVLRAEDVIDQPLVVENPASVQANYVFTHSGFQDAAPIIRPFMTDKEQAELQAAVQARSQAIANALKEVETRATFKLKSMTREFSTDYDVQVTDLKIPIGYNLEAV